MKTIELNLNELSSRNAMIWQVKVQILCCVSLTAEWSELIEINLNSKELLSNQEQERDYSW